MKTINIVLILLLIVWVGLMGLLVAGPAEAHGHRTQAGAFDRNGDGRLSRTEQRAYVRETGKSVYDLAGSGSINSSENTQDWTRYDSSYENQRKGDGIRY